MNVKRRLKLFRRLKYFKLQFNELTLHMMIQEMKYLLNWFRTQRFEEKLRFKART